MEMEHINENLIKVFIDASDLEERGITFLDLVSGQEHIEHFFYSILEEVDIDEHFRDSEAVTFQVMPKQNGIELYISRNDIGDVEGWSSELTKHLMDTQDEIVQHENEKKQNNDQHTTEENDSLGNSFNQPLIIKFESLDDVFSGTQAIDKIGSIHADLYHYDSHYFLDIQVGTSLLLPHQLMAINLQALEYGQKTSMTQAILQEHGHLIRESDAIEYFATTFK